MFYTYVLWCTYANDIGEFYIGYCGDLKSRYKDHLVKEVSTTKKFDKLELIYYEACVDKTDARIREIKLKTGFGRGYLKRRLEKYFKKIGQ